MDPTLFSPKGKCTSCLTRRRTLKTEDFRTLKKFKKIPEKKGIDG